MNSAIGFTEFLPKPWVAVFGTEECGVEPAWQNLQFFRRKSPRNPASPILLRVDKYAVELPVEPLHVMPGYAFHETIVGQNADVLRKVGVINAACLQVQHLRRRQCRQPDGSRSANNNFSESLALNVVEHAQNRWETEFLQLILR